MNQVSLVGRLTKDPELRYTQNGVANCSFTLAVNRPFTNQQGERDADFIRIVVWRRQAENAANYLHKGSQAGVEGRIQTGSYDNNEGKRVYTTDVVADHVEFLEPKGSNNGNASSSHQMPHESRPAAYSGSGRNNGGGPSFEDPFSKDSEPINISDDDLPF